MRVFSTRLFESGFFLSPEHDAFSTAAISEAQLAPWQYALVPLAGLTGQLQFFRVVLAERGGTTTTDHLVLEAHYPRLADPTIQSLAALLRAYAPGAALSFNIEDLYGWSLVSADPLTPPAAAAVAIAKCIVGWDESEPIFVESADHAFDVELCLMDKVWTATVTPTSTPARSPPR